MFRQTPFTQADLNRSTVAREKGGKVRYFDPKTARMSGWMPKPQMPVMESRKSQAAALNAASARIDARQMATVQREVQGLRDVYAAMPVARLRTVASKAGVTGSSRMRKGDVIDALLGQPLSLATGAGA